MTGVSLHPGIDLATHCLCLCVYLPLRLSGRQTTSLSAHPGRNDRLVMSY